MWAIRSKSTSPPEIKKPRLRAPASSSAQPFHPFLRNQLKARCERLGLSLGQQLDQMACQGLHVHDGVPDRAGKGQMQPDGLILKLGPQNSGGIQQFQPLVHRDPLLSPGNAGPVPGLGGFLLGHLVDKGGLAHIGNAHHHGPDRPAHLALLLPPGDLLFQCRPHHGGKLLDPRAAAGVTLQDRDSLGPKVRPPDLAGGRVRLVGPVENDHPGLPPTSSSKSGFRLAMGIRASMTSATMSTYLRFSPIIRRVLVMWPGYHWMFTFLSSPFPAGAAARPGTVLFHN